MQDRCEIDKGIDNKEIKDATDKNEVAQLGLSPLQSTVDEVCEVDYEVNCEIDYEAEIYIIGGYDRLINKLRAKFVNVVSDEKCYKGFVGKERVFILTGYVSYADISKIESLGIDRMFVNSKGLMVLLGRLKGMLREQIGISEGY